ncbi:MAG: glycosyltransferase family 4 protein [Rhodospirillales bacterium]|nr:glycosyltransferase family 4 protein [Rhodospirillales bacterium]
MKILFFDDSFLYDSYTPRHDPMGGPEKGLVYLAEALARRGQDVVVRNRCEAPRGLRGVAWRPIDDGEEDGADLVVALRDPRLLDRAPASGVRVLWLATPGALLTQGAMAESMGRHSDCKLVFMGDYHRATWPEDDARASIIQPGVAPPYMVSEGPAGYWPPRAVVTTHPRVGMERLLDLWCRRIEPMISGAQLHIFSGLFARAASSKKIDADVTAIYRKAEAAADQGVMIRRPVPDADMTEEYRHARVHIYPASPREIYAATLAESQASGCPGVTFREGAAQERIRDSQTGFLAPDDEAFANCSILCLKEDIVYRGRSKDAWEMKRDRSWDDAAEEFEALAR